MSGIKTPNTLLQALKGLIILGRPADGVIIGGTAVLGMIVSLRAFPTNSQMILGLICGILLLAGMDTLNDYLDLEPEVREFEPSFALTDGGDGLSFYNRYSEIFGKLMTDDGLAFLELDSDNSDKIQEVFFNSGFVTFLKNDLSSNKRFIRVTKKK